MVDNYPEYYDKDKSKYWNGYIGQDTVLIDDVELEDKYLLGSFKKWIQHKPFPAEDKFGQMRQIRPKRFIVTSNYRPEKIFDNDAAIMSRFTTFMFPGNVSDEAPVQERIDSRSVVSPIIPLPMFVTPTGRYKALMAKLYPDKN